MKKIIFFAIVCLTLVLSRCTSSLESEKENCMKPDSINPNGTSELSLLMRQMHEKAAEMKQFIEEGKNLGAFPEEFNTISQALPTDSMTKKPSFDAFAVNYLNALQSVYQADASMVNAKYNGMVNACLSCHSDHCPGPVPKIKKLIIN